MFIAGVVRVIVSKRCSGCRLLSARCVQVIKGTKRGVEGVGGREVMKVARRDAGYCQQEVFTVRVFVSKRCSGCGLLSARRIQDGKSK